MPHRSTPPPPGEETFTKERVLQAIESAFGALSPPAPDEVFTASFASSEHPEKESLRKILCEHHWREISIEQANAYWNFRSYLSPVGARQLLAALLWHSTHCFGSNDDNDPSHATIYMVLNGGPAQFPALTQSQVYAVMAFLGLYMDPSPGYQWTAAARLRQWGTPGHPATVLGRAFDDKHRHYEYPPLSPDLLDLDLNQPQDAREWQQKQTLLDQLQQAFAQTPYPQQTDLAGGGFEGAEYDEAFRNTSWKTLHPDFLCYHQAALSFFLPDAFRYFLPAFMRADIYEDGGGWDLVFHLTYQFEGGGYSGHMTERLSRFNAEERHFIGDFLRFLGRYEDIDPRIFDWWAR